MRIIYIVDKQKFENENELNTYLLLKYLTLDFIKQGINQSEAAQLASDYLNKYDRWGYHGLAYSLGARNLEFFALYFLQSIYIGEGKAELAAIHKDIWQELQDAILTGNTDKLEYLLPRGTGKSTFISLALSIWCSVYGYKTYTVIASAIGDTASTFINNIKLALDGNIKIEKAFGKLFDSKKCTVNNEEIELTNRTKIQSISAASTLRGKSYGNTRIELLLLDDYQKDDEVTTNDQREKKWKKFNDDVKYAIQKNNCTMIAVGTVQHQECFYNRLRQLPTWKVRYEKGVLLDDVDHLFNSGLWLEFKTILLDKKKYGQNSLDYAKEFYFQHKEKMQFPLLWSEFWDCLDIAITYYEDPISFKQEVQGDTSAQGKRRFQTIITEPPKDIEKHDFKVTMLCIDPANSLNDKADYTAICVGSKAYNGVKYIRKGLICKVDINKLISNTIVLLLAYKDITHIYIEKNLYMGADILKLKEKIAETPLLKSRSFIFINEMQKKNKIDKIDSIASDVNMGRIIFNEDDTGAIEQIKDYIGIKSLHDDFPDVVSECVKRLDEIQPLQKIKVTENWLRR